MNSKAVGEVSEAVILAHLVKQGYTVLTPFGNNRRYDLVIDHGDHFERVQVKTGRLRNGCVMFNTSSINGFTKKRTSYSGQADTFMVYCPENERIYKVPVEVAKEGQQSLRVDTAKVNMSTIKWAKDYVVG